MPPSLDTTVLVVGAGPVGTMAALLLRRLGIACRVVERRTGPQTAPAAHAVNARTFEICRAAGVDMDAVAAACQDPADAGTVRWVTTLAGQELGSLPYERQDDAVLAVTPTPFRNISQHRLEPILVDALRGAGVAVEWGCAWEGATQDADGVTSRVRTPAGVREIRSRWLLGADGAGSAVRKWLGIEPIGPSRIQSFVMIHIAADMRPLVRTRPAVLFWTVDPDSVGTFVSHGVDREWVFMHPWDPDREDVAAYDEARCTAIVRRALGTADLPFTVRTISPWTMTAQVAERYRAGRAFLVGDSAHRFPPTGGMGLNSGVQDAHNLAWKLAAAEAGWGDDRLLDTYEAERRPVAQANADASLQNALRLLEVYQALGIFGDPPDARAQFTAALADAAGRARVAEAIANQAEHFDMLGLQLGFGYEAGALVPEAGPGPVADPIRTYTPSARPGRRVPHAWVERHGLRASSLDALPLDRFTLVTTPAGAAWTEAAAARKDVPLGTLVLGRDVVDPGDGWRRLLGIAPDGAVLVRPDQHVAWRAEHAAGDAAAALDAALATVLHGRPA